MKTVKILICCVAALVFSLRAGACGPFFWYPYEYYMFRTFDSENCVSWNDTKARNSLLWQSQTSSSATPSDIAAVVYDYSVYQVRSMLSDKSNKNTFAQWVYRNQDKETVDFLILAKKCEYARAEKNSSWYYPTQNDPIVAKIKEVRDEALAYGGTRYASRYALQAIRAMYSLGDNEGIIKYWESKCVSMTEDVIKDLMRPYVAGAYYMLSVCTLDGDEPAPAASSQIDPAYAREMAMKYYAECQWPEYIDVMQNEMDRRDLAATLASVASECPDAPFLAELLQKIMGQIEPESLDSYYVDRMTRPQNEGETAAEVRNICHAGALNCKEAANKAVWYYAAAFMDDLLGEPQKASETLAKAEEVSGSKYINESIKVLRIYLDTKNGRYTNDDVALLESLKWFVGKIRSEITSSDVENTAYGWQLRNNLSYYYWNDMMRRIVLGELCPRMLDAGRQVRALQLANMADNALLNIVDLQFMYDKNWNRHLLKMDKYREKTIFNSLDFSNNFFEMADTLNVGYSVAYFKELGNTSDALGQYLEPLSNVSKDYLCEHIGTLYLRDRDYSKAHYWLAQVNKNYFKHTNIIPYTFSDPFEWDPDTYEGTPIKNYKLEFARTMEKFSMIMEDDDKSCDERGAARAMYGLGLKNSFSLCWALTQYHKFEYDEWKYAPETLKALADAETYIEDGIAIAENREVKARLYLRLKDYDTVQFVYGDTPTGHETLVKCDNLQYWRPNGMTSLN